MRCAAISVSIIAVVLSALALASSFRSSERARECEFLYRTYDRLNELSRYENREKIRQMQCKSLLNRQNTKGVGSVSEEEKKMCNEFAAGIVPQITKLKWELELHRVSFEPTDLSSVMMSADNAIANFKELTNDQETDLWHKFSQFLSAFGSVAKFRLEMIHLIEGAMKTTAESIRDRCR